VTDQYVIMMTVIMNSLQQPTAYFLVIFKHISIVHNVFPSSDCSKGHTNFKRYDMVVKSHMND